MIYEVNFYNLVAVSLKIILLVAIHDQPEKAYGSDILREIIKGYKRKVGIYNGAR